MRGRAKAILFLLLLSSFPVFGQCLWTPRASSPFRATAYDVAVDGANLWLATGYGVELLASNGTRILDVQALPGSTRVVRALTDGRGYAYAGSGSRLYVVQHTASAVNVLRYADAGATINDILIAGTYLFVATANGLVQYDAFEPANPVKRNVLLPTSSPNVTSLAAAGTKLYAADGDDTIEVFSISTPSIPQHTAELKSVPRATAVHAQGDTILVSDAFGQNTDVFTGTTPLGRLPVGANAFAANTNGVHFVAGPDRTLRAIDFTSTNTLRELFEHQLAPTGGTDNVIHAMARSGNTLYVAAGDIGLAVFDITQLAAPYPMASYTSTARTSVVTGSDVAYFADASGSISEHQLQPSGIALKPLRAWNGGTLVHDLDSPSLLTSSGDTATRWSLLSYTAHSSTKFSAEVKEAAFRGLEVVALLADGTVWLSGTTPHQVALPRIAHMARSGSNYLFVEVRNEGKTVLHIYTSNDFTAEPRRVTIDGVAIGEPALDATRAAVFTFSGVNVVDIATGTVRVVTDSNRVIPQQLAFSGDDLLVLDKRVLYVYDDARTLIREQFLAADAVMLDAENNIAVLATTDGTMIVSYLAAQPAATIPFENSFYTKLAAGGGRVYLLSGDGIDIHTPTLDYVNGVQVRGIVDLAAGANGFYTLAANGVVTAYSRQGIAIAKMTLNEGTDAQPLAIDTAGNAVWVSLSRGCLTGGCQKKTLVLDPASLAITASMNGGVTDVVTSGTRAYALFDLPAEIRVLNIADPLHPAQLIATTAPASATSIAAHSGRVLVLGDKLYEYTESTLLQKATHFTTSANPDKAQQVRVEGNCLIVTARGANPETFNAATLAPVAGAFEVPANVRSVAIDGGTAFFLTTHSIEIWGAQSQRPGKRRSAR